ncbi:MAG: VWA domain-containing protein [Syntrophomonadaceae bacterium]|nr:VWA domain-containing protein [Syntrophomonadaceae bacterium]
MSFLNPAAGWFAFIIPLIILLYLLKPKYQEQTISSTFLWEQLIKDIEANRPWQRLKKNLLLFLQLLAAFLLLLAMSRPYIPVAGYNDSHVIAVLDCSSSMMATDVAPSRFVVAQKQIEQLINNMSYKDQMTLIAMGEEPQVLAAASRNKKELLRAVTSIKPGRESAALDPVLEIVSALAQNSTNCSVIIYSDGRTQPAKYDVKLSCPLEFKKIGQEKDNIGIRTLAARESDNHMIVLAQMQNYGDKIAQVDVELFAEDKIMDIRPTSLEPDEVKNLIWEDVPDNTKYIKINLNHKDCYNLDNEAYAVVPNQDRQRILLVSAGNIFLEKAWGILPNVELYKTSPDNYDKDLSEYTAYIFDGFIPGELPHGNILVVNPPAGNSLFPANGVMKNIKEINLAASDDELLKYVDTENWQILESQQIECPTWCNPLAKYQNNMLLGRGELNGKKIALLTFDLHKSNIPLQTSFPILVNNLSNWLLPESTSNITLDASERTFTLDIPPQTGEVIVEKDGEVVGKYTHPFPAAFPVYDPGLYKITRIAGTEQEVSYLAVNQINALESNIAPVRLPLKYYADNNSGNKKLYNYELWKYLIWLLLLVLIIEWEVYRHGY